MHVPSNIASASAALLCVAAAACDVGSGKRDEPKSAIEAPAPTAPGAREPKASIMRPSVVNEVEPAPVPTPQPEPVRATIPFASGGAALDEEARAMLDRLAKAAAASDALITLRGHSDSRGDDEANKLVSARRAEAVRDYLVDRGIAAERVTIIALGEARPVAPNALLDGSDNEEGRRKNRRVDVEIGAAAPAPTQQP